MFNRMLAVAALATVSFGVAQAGTLQNGTWTTKCPAPPEPPVISSKSPEAYNASQKLLQPWADAAKEFQTCLNDDLKSDQQVMIDSATASMNAINAKMTALKTDQEAAVAKLKKGDKKSMSAQ
jgi:hypothetical protein